MTEYKTIPREFIHVNDFIELSDLIPMFDYIWINTDYRIVLKKEIKLNNQDFYISYVPHIDSIALTKRDNNWGNILACIDNISPDKIISDFIGIIELLVNAYIEKINQDLNNIEF